VSEIEPENDSTNGSDQHDDEASKKHEDELACANVVFNLDLFVACLVGQFKVFSIEEE